MTTAAPQQDATLEELTLDAWQRYSEALRNLTGRPYEDAEAEAWDGLQAELADIAALATTEPF